MGGVRQPCCILPIFPLHIAQVQGHPVRKTARVTITYIAHTDYDFNTCLLHYILYFRIIYYTFRDFNCWSGQFLSGRYSGQKGGIDFFYGTGAIMLTWRPCIPRKTVQEKGWSPSELLLKNIEGLYAAE